MSFVDTIKNKVLEQFSSGVRLDDMLASLGIAFLMGAFILLVYRQTFRGVLFSKGFAFSLILLAMVTALVIRTISSNLALSLGMVGALSIVRFRTAVKDPVDTVFMFWSITCGIMAGAGLYLIGACACFGVGLLYFLISKVYGHSKAPYLLVVRYDPEKAANIGKALKQLPKHRLKSRTMTRSGAEITLEVSLKDTELETIDKFLGVDGVLDASLVSYEGEFGL
jgi:hypothetical protein